MTRRNFLFTILGIGAIAKALKPKRKPLTWTKNFMITRNGHEIEFWNDGERISEEEAPFTYTLNPDTDVVSVYLKTPAAYEYQCVAY